MADHPRSALPLDPHDWAAYLNSLSKRDTTVELPRVLGHSVHFTLPAPRTKSPLDKDWQRTAPSRATLDDLLDPARGDAVRELGVACGGVSGWLVRGDWDQPETAIVASHLMPWTGMVHERAGAPNSGPWWRVVTQHDAVARKLQFAYPGLTQKSLHDGKPRRGKVGELLTNGAQSLIPTSRHPDDPGGYLWRTFTGPAEVDGAELALRFKATCVGGLLAIYWPSEGSRNDADLALQGFLAMWSDWPAELIGALIQAVAHAAGDDEWRQRGNPTTVNSTIAHVVHGEAATGRPTLEAVLGADGPAVVAAIMRFLGMTQATRGLGVNAHHGGRFSQRLLTEARQRARLFKGDDGGLYLAEHIRGLEAYPIRSLRTRHWLNRLFRETLQDRPPTPQTITETLETLEADADVAPVYPVRVRVAALADQVLLDLGDDAGRVVVVDERGWEPVTADHWQLAPAPVYFTRPKHALALPTPDPRGTLADVRACLPAVSEDVVPLVDSYLLHCFQHVGDFWVMTLVGEQGSGKSLTAEALRTLIDPSRAPSSGPPRDEDALVAYANNAGMVVFDNLSTLPEWLSDALCRMSTGAGLLKRQLYTDLDVAGWYGKRPVILTTITDIIHAGDLLNRSLIVPLQARPEAAFTSKAQLWARVQRQHPRALGGILNALADTLAALPGVQSEWEARLPRMTDACLYGLALERALGRPAGQFMGLYNDNQRDALETQLDGSKIAEYLCHIVASGVNQQWSGTMSQLLVRLNSQLEREDSLGSAEQVKREKWWPKTAAHLSAAIARLAPALRSAGYTLDSARPQRGAPKVYTFRRLQEGA